MARPVSRRSLLALAGGLATQAGCFGSAAAPLPPGGNRSGLPWMSGICCGRVITADAAAEIDKLEAFRGRRMDVQTTFSEWRRGWDAWLDAPVWRNGLAELLARRGMRVSAATPLLCVGSEGRFADGARGDFDAY